MAGADTTSTAVQSTLLAIRLNPQVYQDLKREIHSSIQNDLVSYPIRDVEAKQLSYLQACVFEGLRKFPPLSQLRERVVPPEGDEIQGHRIPGGTFIGLNSWGTQLDEVYGDAPEVFRPERWLIDDEARLKAMFQTHELIFGYGSSKCLGMPIAMMELSKMIFEVSSYSHFLISIVVNVKGIVTEALRDRYRQPLQTLVECLLWDLFPNRLQRIPYTRRLEKVPLGMNGLMSEGEGEELGANTYAA